MTDDLVPPAEDLFTPTEEVDAGGPATGILPRPRTRWAAIIWGLVLGTIAVAALWVLLDPTRREGITEWLLGLSPLSLTAYAVLVVGGLLLVAGLVGLARRAQRAVIERST